MFYLKEKEKDLFPLVNARYVVPDTKKKETDSFKDRSVVLLT